jgi:hypothetical protein
MTNVQFPMTNDRAYGASGWRDGEHRALVIHW